MCWSVFGRQHYIALLAGFCGLDPDAGCVEERRLFQEYFAPTVRKLDPALRC